MRSWAAWTGSSTCGVLTMGFLHILGNSMVDAFGVGSVSVVWGHASGVNKAASFPISFNISFRRMFVSCLRLDDICKT